MRPPPTAAPTAVLTAAAGADPSGSWRFGQRAWTAGALGLVLLLSPAAFADPDLTVLVLSTVLLLGALAAGLVPLLIIRRFDLSVNATAVLAGVLLVASYDLQDDGELAALPLILVLGGLIGLANGAAAAYTRIASAGVTAATTIVVAKLAVVLAGDRVSDDGVLSIPWGENTGDPVDMLTLPALWLVVLVGAGAVALRRRGRLGRRLYAIGGRTEGSAASRGLVIGLFVVSGVVAAGTGMIIAITNVLPISLTPLGFVPVVAYGVAVVGGVSLLGGAGGPVSVPTGALVVAALAIPAEAAGLSRLTGNFTGLVVVAAAAAAAVALDLFRRRATILGRRRRPAAAPDTRGRRTAA
jgi:ribose transport system permease protein